MHSLGNIDAAGGLTLDANERILFIFKDGRWDLPKGLVDRSRSAARTAVDETAEETGVSSENLEVITELISTVHLSKYAKTKSLKHVRWFLLRYTGGKAEFEPQSKEGIEHCAWIPLWDLERPLANCPPRIHYLVNFWIKIRKELDY